MSLLGGIEGPDSVLTALFVVLALDAFSARPDKTTLTLAGGFAALAPAHRPRLDAARRDERFTASLVLRNRLRGKPRHA